jgi:hypothetical protein
MRNYHRQIPTLDLDKYSNEIRLMQIGETVL